MSLYLFCIIILVSPLNNAVQYSKVENIFHQNIGIRPGDVLQCDIIKTNIEESNNYQLFTQVCPSDACYIHQPISGKCFSFKVRAPSCACIMLNSVSYTDKAYKLEVILANGPSAYIRESTHTTQVNLAIVNINGIINDREYSGFWIRWLDDELLEIGRESETIPFLYHRFAKKLQINYTGIFTCGVRGSWIIHRESKCPDNNGTNLETRMRAESECFIVK